MVDRMRTDASGESETPVTDEAAAAPTRKASLDFFLKDNAKEHHTIKFSLVHKKHGPLVIRRGHPFKMAINFHTGSPDDHNIELEMRFGHEPNSNKGSRVHLKVTDNKEFTRPAAKWDVKRADGDEKKAILHVQVPPTIGIGVWTINVILKGKDGKQQSKMHHNIYILFNPWCKEDTVYMENEHHRKEYVLNAVGKLYSGTYDEFTSRRWVYGQYTATSLPACMYLLDLSGLLYNARSNPVLVARQISNMTNKAERNDRGVLIGKWGESADDYRDGTAPWSWTGSSGILEQFLNNKGTPVKYAQCWVFAGLSTTISRCLGIPSRNVTCFVAGHDTDETLTIDVIYDSAGNRLAVTSDSIWNFHCWSEVWMERLDLPAGYGGWQVIDGTPQETSDGAFQLGPTSVKAVKKGEVGSLYDTLFVFSEVNADLVNWTLRDDQLGLDRASVDTRYMGQRLITKKPGKYDHNADNDYEDITHTYKYKEGTAEERMAVMNAGRTAGKSLLLDIDNEEKREVVVELGPVINIMTGDSFQMTLTIENRSSHLRTVSVVLCCCSIHYNGVISSKIREEKKTVSVDKFQKTENYTTWTVTSGEYIDHLVEFGMIKIYGMATILETGQTWAGERDFAVKKPKLILEILNELKVGKKYSLRVIFKNPYKKPLTGCLFSAEGPGLLEYTHYEHRDINGQEQVVQEFPVSPTYKCETAVVAAFVSNELSDITGSKHITITK